MSTELCQVTTTTDRADEAERLASGVVAARLGACAQVVGPIRSVYRWQGEVHTDQEWQLIIKTRADLVPALTAHLVAAHSYDLPEVVVTPITGGSPDYLDWIRAETRAEPS